MDEPVPPPVEPVPVDDPLPSPPGVCVVLEPEPMDEPVPVLSDAPPAALELPWSRRHWSFCRPVSVSQRALLEVEPVAELPEFIAPLPLLVLEPPTLEPVEPPRLEPLDPLEPPTLLPDVPPALAPAPLPAAPAPPPDCAYAVIAKRAAAVAVTKSFNFIC
jgi:hypothetical protein